MNYRIAVRALCEFTAKEGDLDLRFTPAPTAQEGIAGHRTVVLRRGAGYISEVTLAGEYPGLLVAGRADGYDPQANLLEEIKTHRGDVKRIPQNHRILHWAQAKVYGHLLCAERGLDEIDLAVVYFNVISQKETVLRERFDAGSLKAFFDLQCSRFVTWARQEDAHRQARNASLEALKFPFASFRKGQRQLAEAVYRAARDGDTLMTQATTGIGKTLATLFPQLKAFPGQNLDRLFFLTAKTPGRRLALDALAALRSQHERMPLRVLEHVARDKACEFPDRACHGESCPLATGFYDRLPAARLEALESHWLTQQQVREVASRHQVCPYYLSQELCRWVDVVVCDYNYYFDMTALLFGLTILNDWRVTLLVDEAHNLVDRGRGMYTAELDQGRFNELRKTAPVGLKSSLDRVNRHWNQLHKEQQAEYQIYPAIADLFILSLQKAVSAITDHLTDQPTGNDAALLRFYLDAMSFTRLAETYGDHSLFDITRHSRPGQRTLSTLCLRNIVPAPYLATRFAIAHSATLFSATLSPPRYYMDLLGLPAATRWLEVDSPFSAEQLEVRIARNVSTRYQHRGGSLESIGRVLADRYRDLPGNYLAFFSSYAYLQQVIDHVRIHHPDVPVWEQSRNMSEAERQAFLDRFTASSQGIGFAVLGGAFGEGIDLPGARLIGAFIATLGLPQVNAVNEEIRARMQSMFGNGYDYAYLYPGLQKVVQAAGRVIRTTSDRGMVMLLDDRFGQPQVRGLLPGWWSVDSFTVPQPQRPRKPLPEF